MSVDPDIFLRLAVTRLWLGRSGPVEDRNKAHAHFMQELRAAAAGGGDLRAAFFTAAEIYAAGPSAAALENLTNASLAWNRSAMEAIEARRQRPVAPAPVRPLEPVGAAPAQPTFPPDDDDREVEWWKR